MKIVFLVVTLVALFALAAANRPNMITITSYYNNTACGGNETASTTFPNEVGCHRTVWAGREVAPTYPFPASVRVQAQCTSETSGTAVMLTAYGESDCRGTGGRVDLIPGSCVVHNSTNPAHTDRLTCHRNSAVGAAIPSIFGLLIAVILATSL